MEGRRMSFTDALPLLAIAGFVWAEIRGTEKLQKVVLVAGIVAIVIWVLSQ